MHMHDAYVKALYMYIPAWNRVFLSGANAALSRSTLAQHFEDFKGEPCQMCITIRMQWAELLYATRCTHHVA